jgi:hypothetical protein
LASTVVVELGDLAAGLDLADPRHRALVYQEMGITGVYQPALRVVTISADPDTRRPTVVPVGGLEPGP